jgi:hypothetical protein
MHQAWQASKVETFHRGNVLTKEGRAEQSKIIDAEHRTLAKVAHPDHGGSTEEMKRLNVERDDLRAAINKPAVIDWWRQEFNDIAAQMAKHFTIKKISELCAIAVDLRKAMQAHHVESTPPPTETGGAS